MNIAFEGLRQETLDLRRYYENQVFNALRSIARHAWAILLLVLAAIVLMSIILTLLPRSYRSEAVVEPLRFVADATVRSEQIASLNGTELVTSDAMLIDSLPTARAVVKRLGLADEATQRDEDGTDILSRLRAAILPETVTANAADRVARKLLDRLNIAHDRRSYLIKIAYTTSDPEEAARIANAFALTYVDIKKTQKYRGAVASASEKLAKLSVMYGAHHPSLMASRSSLAFAEAQLKAHQTRNIGSAAIGERTIEGIIFATPESRPSGPAGVVLLVLATLGALVVGCAMAVALDRRDRGFETGAEVEALTGITHTCIVPSMDHQKNADGSQEKSDYEHAAHESLRLLAVRTKLAGEPNQNKLAMLTGLDFDDATDETAVALAKILVEHGHRVLCIHAAPLPTDVRSKTLSAAIGNDVADLRNLDNPLLIIAPEAELQTDEFRRNFGRDDIDWIVRAKKEFDNVIVAAPAAALSADASLIGHRADVNLLVGKWKSTPKSVIRTTQQQLLSVGARIDGLVLTQAGKDYFKTVPMRNHFRHIRQTQQHPDRTHSLSQKTAKTSQCLKEGSGSDSSKSQKD